jgi:DNA primase
MMKSNSQIDQFKRELDLSNISKKEIFDRSFLQEDIDEFLIGLCPPTSNYSFDLLNGRIVVPIFDVYGNHIAFAGRRLDHYSTNVKDFYIYKYGKLAGIERFFKWKTSKWINTPYKKSDHLFNLNKSKRFIFDKNFSFLVEGYYDVIHMNKFKHNNVVGLCGTSISDRQCELLFRYTKNLVIMLDGDNAGQMASYTSMLKSRNNNLFTHVVQLPDNKDPDDLDNDAFNFIVEQVKNAKEELLITL